MAEEVRAGYKRTEVGVIPEGWEVVMLASISSMKSGEGITAASIDPYSRYRCFGGNGLRGYTSRYTHDGDYALIGRQGALCGNVVGVEGEFFASEHAIVVAASATTDIKWLTIVLDEMRLNQYSESSAQPGLSVSRLLGLYVAVPPTTIEQRAIAEALSEVDALLGALDRLIAKKRDLKQAAMQELLTGRVRLPGFEGEWRTVPLAAICSMKSGESITNDDIDQFSPYRCFGGNGLRGFVSRFTHDGEHALVGRQGALCGNILRVSGKFFASEHAIVVTAIPQSDIIWLTHVLESMRLNQYAESSAQPGLSVVKVLKLCVAAPPSRTEQTAIATVLSDMDVELTALEQRRDKTRALKQGMMQELLTGRIRLV